MITGLGPNFLSLSGVWKTLCLSPSTVFLLLLLLFIWLLKYQLSRFQPVESSHSKVLSFQNIDYREKILTCTSIYFMTK